MGLHIGSDKLLSGPLALRELLGSIRYLSVRFSLRALEPAGLVLSKTEGLGRET